MPESGTHEEWNQLIGEQLPAALRLAVRLTGNVHDAEDLVQEAVLRAARGLPGFQQRSSVRTWFYRILVNTFRSHRSSRQSRTDFQPLDAESGPTDRTPDTCEQLAGQENGVRVARAIAELPARQREVLVLIVYESQTASEVADVLGMNVQNVYSNLSAARATLKQRLSSLNPFH